MLDDKDRFEGEPLTEEELYDGLKDISADHFNQAWWNVSAAVNSRAPFPSWMAKYAPPALWRKALVKISNERGVYVV